MKPFVSLVAFIAVALLAPCHAISQGKVARSVTNETVEKNLQDLGIKFQKGERKEKDASVVYYDFNRNGTPTRLLNYGSDLWLETTVEKKLKLDDVNRWNASAKFSRLVLIDQKDKTILSLEAQLDCLGGVTDAMIKQYVNRFDAEAQKFAKFVK